MTRFYQDLGYGKSIFIEEGSYVDFIHFGSESGLKLI